MQKIIKQRLFPYNGDKLLFNKLLIDDDSVNYISNPIDSNIISNIILDNCNKLNLKNITITDATAGTGGNVISFIETFSYVNAIEIDPTRYKYLLNNINVYNLGNITVYCDNCLNLLNEIDKQDVIFIDPPWGGKSYKEKKNLKLYLSGIGIEDICLNLLTVKAIPSLVVIKLPINYNLKYFYNKLKYKYKILLYEMNKMNIVVLKNLHIFPNVK